ncbi:MAG: FAD-dependent oxidoreductase [Acidobacteriota bacterium]|nr:FAD-dependent oxidoreductase [Acidobacteriota bacterium]
MPDLLVFSHLRWDFVYQRPQQLMTRFAEHYRVFFFEEPERTSGAGFLEMSHAAANVLVCRPHTTVPECGFHDAQLPVLQRLLDQLMTDHGLTDPVVWLYTAMALPLVHDLRPRAVVYDCMDELSAFLQAPRQLLQRESALLRLADVVFTGGPSLFRSKQSRHKAVYCFPSSVDQAHFAQAREPAIEHAHQRGIPNPRLGYFGVIDERLDLGLIAFLADARPHWQICMVGPVVKIDPALLPIRRNIHYFGQQGYAELPKFLAGWDVCLLPFAINAATRFISPTKLLEYMAAEKMIVSTPITDVVEPYGDMVYVGSSSESFLLCCERALAAEDNTHEAKRTQMRAVVKKSSWDDTATKMRAILEAVITSRRNGVSSPLQSFPTNPPMSSPTALLASSPVPSPTHRPVIVIGAGPTGLSAAYHIGEQALLFEQHDAVGGWCRSTTDNGFTFDYAGHIMFSNDPYVHQLYSLLLKDNVHWQDREAWIYSNEVYTRYPFQGALYGLPPDVLKDCLVGAIEARFGSIGAAVPESLSATAKQAGGSTPSSCKAESITDCCADGVIEGATAFDVRAPSTALSAEAPRNFEEFIYSVWGSGVAEHFALPYNRKLWTVPLSEMETSWLGGRVPLPDLEQMIDGALRPTPKPMGPNARFGYPLRGGFQALMEGFVPILRGELKLNSRVARIIPSEHQVVLADGSTYTYEQLVSTMPLPVLIRLLGKEAPTAIQAAAKRLRFVSVRCVNLGVGRPNVTDKHWIYYPGQSVFHRIFVQGNASPHVNAPGGFGLTCEITYSPHKPLPCDGDDLLARCIADCIKVGIIRADDPILAQNQLDMPYAYVVYDHQRAENVATIRRWLSLQDIVLAGRYSEWEYYNSDHAFLAGKKAAATVRAALSEKTTTKIAHRGTSAAGSAPPPS